MKRTVFTKAAVILIVFQFTVMAFSLAQAQEQGSDASVNGVELAEPAPWLQTKDYSTGALLAIGGLVGALIAAFFLVGGPISAVAGSAKIEAETKHLEELSKRLSDLVRAATIDAPALAAVEKTVDNLRDDLRSDIRWQYVVASVIYAIVGAAIAALLARDLLQAVLIGAGWTGLLGSLGLKKDYGTRKEVKDATLQQALSVIGQAPGLPAASRDAFIERANVALAL